MNVSYNNKVMSSFVLWFNYWLQQKGGAYVNCGTLFYPTNQQYNGLYAYASPYKQFVSDMGISGAQVPTGLFLNGNFVTTGVSGFHGIDYENGRAYFTSQLPTNTLISGNVSYKEINVDTTKLPEEVLLFETQYTPFVKQGQTPTGLASNQIPYPVIFLKHYAGRNEPFAFGGQDNTINQISAVILANSQFMLDSVVSLFSDRNKTVVGLLDTGDYPYNMYGELRTGYYNYTGLSNGKTPLFVEDVTTATLRYSLYNEMRKINPEIYLGVIDFLINNARYPRQE